MMEPAACMRLICYYYYLPILITATGPRATATKAAETYRIITLMETLPVLRDPILPQTQNSSHGPTFLKQ